MVLEFYVGPSEVAVYYAATKTLVLVAFVYYSVSAATAHRFTEYHVAGDRAKLEAFLAGSIRWTFWPSLIATIGLLVLGKFILALFGPGFDQGYYLLFVLAVGLLARAATGPVEPAFATAAAALPAAHAVGAILVRAETRLVGLLSGRVEGIAEGRPVPTFVVWTPSVRAAFDATCRPRYVR